MNKNHIDYKVNHSNKVISIQSGKYQVNGNIVTPYGYEVVIKPGTEFLLGEGISFFVRGGISILGNMSQPVIINRADKSKAFGVFAVAGENIQKSKVSINYLKFGGGSEAIVNGILFTGQMSIINANVDITNSTFNNSISDDGINIKFSKVNIDNSKFFNNFGDQIDLDYSDANITNSIFSYIRTTGLVGRKTDGLDISGSRVSVTESQFSNLSDKGISVGELSNIYIGNNIFSNNNLAIAVKDGSKAFVDENKWTDNMIDISMYIKKKIYSNPSLQTISSNKLLNFEVSDGAIVYSKDVRQNFEAIK